MFKKIKNWLINLKRTRAQKAQLVKMRKYYTLLQSGAEFIRYVINDLAKTKQDINRTHRRRMQRSIKSGKITNETVRYYQKNIDNVLKEIKLRLNPPKITKGGDKND